MGMNLPNKLIDILGNYCGGAVFTIPGSLMQLLRQFDEHPKFQLYTATHEEHLGFMALGYYMMTGKTPIVLVTQGPGVTNLINPVSCFWRDHAPLVIITAFSETKDFIEFQGSNGEGNTPNIKKILSSITESQFKIDDKVYKTEFPRLAKALKETIHPLLLEVNFSQGFICDLKSVKQDCEILPRTNFTNILKKINVTPKTAFVIGKGARHIPKQSLVSSIQRTGAKIVCTMGALDLIPTCTKNFLGMVGTMGDTAANKFLANECEAVISIGASLNRHTVNNWLNQFLTKPHNISYIDMRNAILPSLANHENINVDFRNCIFDEIEFSLINTPKSPTNKIMERLASEYSNKVFVLECFRKSFFRDNVIDFDDRVLTSASHGSLGCSLPMAIGSALFDDRPHIVICGDGGFLFSLTALLTLSRYKLNVLVLVLVNNEFKTVADNQRRKLGKTICTDLFCPDYNYINKTFNVYAKVCNENSEFDDLIKWFSVHKRPAVGFIKDDLLE